MIEIVGLAVRYDVVCDERSAQPMRLAPRALRMPDEGCPLLVDHDHERRVGWVLRPWIHDDAGLVILAEVREGFRLPGLGLSVNFVSAAHYETRETLGGIAVTTYDRAWITEISIVRDPACRGAGIRGWRPALRLAPVPARRDDERDTEAIKEAA